MDRVVVQDLRLPARIGWTSEERATPQDLFVTAEMVADLSLAGSSDSLEDTVDYHAAVRTISVTWEVSEPRLPSEVQSNQEAMKLPSAMAETAEADPTAESVAEAVRPGRRSAWSPCRPRPHRLPPVR